jgi:hypothetical protein
MIWAPLDRGHDVQRSDWSQDAAGPMLEEMRFLGQENAALPHVGRYHCHMWAGTQAIG